MSKSIQSYVEDLVSVVRIGQFASVGFVGAVTDTGLLVVLTSVVGLPAAVSNALSIEAAILVMFAVNDNWTFASQGQDGARSLGRRLLRSHLVRATGSTVQYVIFVAIFYSMTIPVVVSGYDLWLVVVKGGAIACATVINYTFESLFTWRVQDEG